MCVGVLRRAYCQFRFGGNCDHRFGKSLAINVRGKADFYILCMCSMFNQMKWIFFCFNFLFVSPGPVTGLVEQQQQQSKWTLNLR